jgi:hypothetical protein
MAAFAAASKASKDDPVRYAEDLAQQRDLDRQRPLSQFEKKPMLRRSA